MTNAVSLPKVSKTQEKQSTKIKIMKAAVKNPRMGTV
jgi:hypothetical protein